MFLGKISSERGGREGGRVEMTEKQQFENRKRECGCAVIENVIEGLLS